MLLTVLHPEHVDDYRREVEAGRVGSVLPLAPADISLGAAVELACWHSSGAAQDPRIDAQLGRWAKTCGTFATVLDALAVRQERPPRGFETLPLDIRSVPTRDEFAEHGSPWALFCMGFARSLRNIGGFDSELARALADVLHELVDNVLEHAGPLHTPPCRGVVGYHVVHGETTFAVGDLGQGVLKSLQTNPMHVRLSTSEAALVAVVRDHATRRTSFAEGGGIKLVFASLASLQGTLRFRSADAVLTVQGEFYRLPLRVARSPMLCGLQISVTCTPREAVAHSRQVNEFP
jgi:hypothetical protein